MCNFNALSNEEKSIYHQKILKCADSFGGKSFFLHLLEAIRANKPHPIVSADKRFDMELGSIKWNKVIFNDKLQLLLKARVKEGEQDNFLPNVGDKNYKKILNVVRTLKPIVFQVTPSDISHGSAFFVQPFDVIDENKTKLNPIFDALFFCSVETIKKALNYNEAKA